MRKLIVALLVFSSVFLEVPARSAAGQSCNPSATGGAIDCGGERGAVTQTDYVPISSASSGSSTASSSPATRYVPYDRLVTQPDGQGCVTTGYVAEGTTPADAVPDDTGNQIEGAGGYNNVFAEYPPCPEQPRAPGQPAPAETRAMLAARYWEQIPLPRPQPRIAPGRAITGKLAYLETRGEIAHTYTNGTVFGPLQIFATGSYTVAWGDGETSGPHSYEGQPWPGGQITHEYVDVGAYDIVVSERWTATWALDGEAGVLRTLQTAGRIDDFPVEQIQAVITR